MDSSGRAFFRHLFDLSLAVIERFPITLGPSTMEHITATLEPSVIASRSENPFTAPTTAAVSSSRSDIAVGMNTVGMLLDRLSILAMKHWNTVHRARAPDKAELLVDTQVVELIAALAESRPGQSSVNNKMTIRKVDVVVDDFPGAYYGLLTTNMLLWEAQEILYNHDISILPCEELRAYIDFFSRGNIARNEYIQAADVLFWTAVRA